jgi:DedD protein
VNDVLKQRLVGALILVALGVIFWPIIFVQPGDREMEEIQPLPMRPGVSETPVEPPDRVGLRASPETTVAETQAQLEDSDDTDRPPYPVPAAPDPEAQPLQAAAEAPAAERPAPSLPEKTPVSSAREAAPEPLAVDSDGVPVAWILQIVSVSSADKAEELRARLVALNYKAYVTQVKSNGKTLYRVYLGPKFERDVLEKLQPDIDAEFGVKSMIRRYVP